MRIIENLHSTNGSYNESSFSRRLLNVFKNKDLIELRQKLKKLSIYNHYYVRINQDVLAKSSREYLEETLSLLKNETDFNERIHSKINKLKSNTSTYIEYVKAKQISDEEILSQQRNLNDRLKEYLKQSNVKIDSYLIKDLIMFAKNVYKENEGSLGNIDKNDVFNKLIAWADFKFIIDNIEFLGQNGFIEEYKQDRKIDYPKFINYMIDTGRGFYICRYFRDFEKISYEDYKIIVDKLREKKVSVQDINTFINAYLDKKRLIGDSGK